MIDEDLAIIIRREAKVSFGHILNARQLARLVRERLEGFAIESSPREARPHG